MLGSALHFIPHLFRDLPVRLKLSDLWFSKSSPAAQPI